MQIVNERPPIWDEVCEMIGAIPRKAIFCWGDTIYNPDGLEVADYLVVHEEVHSKQQEAYGGPEKWWSRYIDDPWFRTTQEVEAYAAQYRFMAKRVGDRNARVKLLHGLAGSLSGPLYGRVISHGKAMQMLRTAAKI